jgi:hypothetical protein
MDGYVYDAPPQARETRTVRRRGLIAGAAALAAGFLAQRNTQPTLAIDGDALRMGQDPDGGTDLSNLAGKVTHVITGYNADRTYTGDKFFVFDAASVNAGQTKFNIESVRAIGAGNRPGLVAMVEGTTVGTPAFAAVYATGATTGSSATLPSGAVGVYGTTTNHAAIRGHSTNYIGAWGSSIGGVGVRGESTNDTGVVGAGGANGGAGVKAFGGTGGGSGLVAIADGASDPGPAQGSAIYGRGAGTTHIGIRGDSAGGNGVQGSSTSSSGVLGISTAARGVYGQIPAASSAPGTIGVHGECLSTGTGGIGVMGASTNGYGVSGTTSGVGVVAGLYGTSNTAYGIIGHTAAAGYSGLTAITGTTGVAALAATSTNANAYAAYFQGTTVVQGNFAVVGGNKSAAVKDASGQHRLVYCMESPESWFEDFGKAKLVNGHADVALDKTFAEIVHTDDYHVFLTEYDGHNDLYVTKQSPAGFAVQAKNGAPSGSFSYRVVAKRADSKGERLAKFDLPKINTPDESKLPKAAPSPLPPIKP